MLKTVTILINAFLLFFVSVTGVNSQWTPAGLNTSYVNALLTYGTNIFAGTGSGIYMTTNMGDNWTLVNNASGRSFTSSGNNIFAGTFSNGVYLSTNGGLNWMAINNGLTANYVRALAVHGSNVFAGTTTGGVFISTNNGESWSAVNNGLTNLYVFSLFVHGNDIFAGTDNGGAIFKSTNDGASWILSGAQSDYTYAFTSNVTNVFAGTDLHGVYITTNNGTSWQTVNNGLPSIFVNSMTAYGSVVFAGTHLGVAYTTNDGALWNSFSSGLPENSWIYGMAIDSPYIFAGLYSPQKGVWKRLLSEIVSAKPINENLPAEFALFQNYPNPFNPMTKITFDLPKASHVKLIIYDIQGCETLTLINEDMKPGRYEYKWDGSNFASGIYFYKLITKDFSHVNKMALIR